VFLECFDAEKIRDKKIAALGVGTAAKLMEFGIRPDFTGQGNKTAQIGAAFKKTAGAQRVFFPLGDKSLKAVSAFVSNKIEAVIYRTLPIGDKAKSFDGVFFTSPSNVEGFLLENPLPPSQICLAIGPSTARSLSGKCGVLHSVKPKEMAKSLASFFLQS
jgi:uroporphyrinogen-III synthase